MTRRGLLALIPVGLITACVLSAQKAKKPNVIKYGNVIIDFKIEVQDGDYLSMWHCEIREKGSVIVHPGALVCVFSTLIINTKNRKSDSILITGPANVDLRQTVVGNNMVIESLLVT